MSECVARDTSYQVVEIARDLHDVEQESIADGGDRGKPAQPLGLVDLGKQLRVCVC